MISRISTAVTFTPQRSVTSSSNVHHSPPIYSNRHQYHNMPALFFLSEGCVLTDRNPPERKETEEYGVKSLADQDGKLSHLASLI
jgi:hypothetical protein